jgi:hypothetical protein
MSGRNRHRNGPASRTAEHPAYGGRPGRRTRRQEHERRAHRNRTNRDLPRPGTSPDSALPRRTVTAAL